MGLGTTAADLGFSQATFADGTLTGADVYSLHRGTLLSSLNDGSGVRISDDLGDIDDLTFTLRDGTTTFGVDLSGASTLGDVVDAINNDGDNADLVTAAIDASGRGITITDNTDSTNANLIVSNGAGSSATDLGIEANVAAASVDGQRLVSGLRDTLLSQLDGGKGLTLGNISIQNRDATTAQIVNLSSAETLADVVDLINTADVGVSASINSSRSGLLITDVSGGTGQLRITDSGDTATATALGLTSDTAVASVDSGTLNRQTVSETTLLSELNGGEGVRPGRVQGYRLARRFGHRRTQRQRVRHADRRRSHRPHQRPGDGGHGEHQRRGERDTADR